MVYVGIDVSKDRLDVQVLPEGQREGQAFAVTRDGAGLAGLIDRLVPLSPDLVAVEATGGFETVVAAALAGAGLPLVVVNPSQVRHFAQALGRRAKTDPLILSLSKDRCGDDRPLRRGDAARGAAAARCGHRALLSDLVARRRQIIEMIVSEKNRQCSTSVPRIARSIARPIKAPEKELAEIDAEIDTGVRGSPAWREREDLLASVPGVGAITARTLIAEMPERGTLDAKRIASLAGLAPYTRQSGRWAGKAMIGGGRDGSTSSP